MNITGSRNGTEIRNYVYDSSSLAWVAMTQPLVKTDTLTVTGTVNQGTGGSSAWLQKLNQTQVTGSLGELDATVSADVSGAVGTAVFQVSGTWKGKIVVEGAVDGVYNNISIVQPSGVITFTGVNNDNMNGVYRVLLIAGYTRLRLRMSSYTSGSATIVVNTAPLVPTAYSWQLNAANLNTLASGKSSGSWYPLSSDDLILDEVTSLRLDTAGNLVTRSSVLTDEGSLYEPFAGSTLSTDWTKSEGAGTSVTVANSVCAIASGTTSGSKVSIDRTLDYAPLIVTYTAKLSQRVANQDIFLGFGDNPLSEGSDTMFARFHFYGTDATYFSCETQSSSDTDGSEGKNTQEILPSGYTTAEYLQYRIVHDGTKVQFYIGKSIDTLILVCTHSVQIPDQYTVMYSGGRIHNSGVPSSSTTLSIDTIVVNNINILDTKASITGFASVNQNVIVSTVNSSTTNLTAGSTFTGSSETTLGIAAIQVNVKADQNVTVYVDQSMDGTNFDITDEFIQYYSLGGNSWTVQATGSYYRVRVTNNGAATTTTFRLQTCLCPMAEAVPRSLDERGNFKTGIFSIQDEYGFEVENTSTGEMRTVIPMRLVGTTFEGSTVDTNFWTVTNTSNGTTAQANGEIVLSTNTTSANGATVLASYRKARFIAGNQNVFRGIIKLSAGATDNKRRFGIANGATMPTITDGAYFELDGTTFSVVTMKGGSETRVSSGSFNGDLGATFDPSTTNRAYEIYYDYSKVWFVVGKTLLHTVTASSTTWSATLGHYIFMDNVNSNSLQTNHTITCRGAYIRRLGSLTAQPTSYYHASGTTAGVQLKIGAGNLHSIVFGSAANNAVITLVDNTTGSTPPLWVYTATGALAFPVSIDFKGMPFYNGLRFVVATGNASFTVVYE